MEALQEWPEPIVRVQSMSESGATAIPDKYVQPPSDRPSFGSVTGQGLSIPVIDLVGVADGSVDARAALRAISDACKEWGFFQVVNHGVCPDLMAHIRKMWKEFFHLPMEVKEAYANEPRTHVGYGSRTAVDKDAVLEWTDYFYLELPPESAKNYGKWPTRPDGLRGTTEEYSHQVGKLCGQLMKLLSVSLGLDEGYLQKAFGGEDVWTCIRAGFYPKCPQPELALGLSAHSDPGGLTVLLADEHVSGLQVRKGEEWIDVKPEPNAFIVNIGDQTQLISNGTYTSVEHRVVPNCAEERLSLAFFCNPNKELTMEPAQQLVTPNQLLHYQPIVFNEYRLHLRQRLMSPHVVGKQQPEAVMAA